MIDIKFLRENPDIVRENIKKKFQGENFICPVHFSFVIYSPVLSVNFKSYSRFLRSSSP